MQDNSKKYVLRSMMFVPGHNEKLLLSASRSIADALIPDVEDSVPPQSKQMARDLIKSKIREGIFNNFWVFPRLNDRESGHLLKDVQELTIEGVDGFVYPKAKSGEDIYFFDKLLEAIEYERGLPIGQFKIVPLIETAAGVLNVQNICRSSGRVIAIAYGCEDFVADLGGIHDHEGKSLLMPRAMIAMAAKAAGVIPIDTVHINVHDLEDLEKNIKLAKVLGFEGMLIIHPKELEIAHKHFTISKEQYSEALEMLRLSDEAKKMNKGVAVLDGRFIGPPLVLTARKIIQKYEMVESENERNIL